MTTYDSIANNPIRVSVPATVAFNPRAFKTSVAVLMEKLGCGKCFSGFDCHFHLQRDYVINPADFKEITEVAPQVQNRNVVNLSLAKERTYDIESINQLIDRLHGKFGCAPCHSGYDFNFQNQIEEILSL